MFKFIGEKMVKSIRQCFWIESYAGILLHEIPIALSVLIKQGNRIITNEEYELNGKTIVFKHSFSKVEPVIITYNYEVNNE